MKRTHFTDRTTIDKRDCPTALRIATSCFPKWQGDKIIIVEADPTWCFKPVTGDVTIVKTLDMTTFKILEAALSAYWASPGRAVVMSCGALVRGAHEEVVAIVVPAISAMERAICVDALLDRGAHASIAMIEACGRDHCTAELICAALDSYARALDKQTAALPYT